MGENSGIQWTHHTFNPWVGCQRISPGCTYCYAEAYDKRVGGGFVGTGDDRHKTLRWGPTAPRVRTSAANWRKPIAWDMAAKAAGERHRVFCASLADVFEDRPELEEWRADLFSLIDDTPHLDWLLLTKRPENIGRLTPWKFYRKDPRPNVWLGTTVEDQQRANERIPHLVAAPAVVHFLSCEPLLEAVDLSEWLDEDKNGFCCRIDWVIIGGESGGKARPFQTDWALSVIQQCRDAGRGDPRPFVKQMGSVWARTSPRADDSHGGDPSEWPEALRVREFPR